jgi:hypothetical protein
MMRRDDHLPFWVTGARRDRTVQRGIWGVGYVSGTAGPLDPPDISGDGGHWLDDEARLAAAFAVPIDVQFFAEPVGDGALGAAGINDLEIHRRPQMGNPSYVTPGQLTAIDRLLPESIPSRRTEEKITVNRAGAEFGSAEQNARVEAAAMTAMTAHYTARGWEVHDVSGDKVGCDLTRKSPISRMCDTPE